MNVRVMLVLLAPVTVTEITVVPTPLLTGLKEIDPVGFGLV